MRNVAEAGEAVVKGESQSGGVVVETEAVKAV